MNFRDPMDRIARNDKCIGKYPSEILVYTLVSTTHPLVRPLQM